ncbi:hypothetical protein [Pseudomonas sp.]|uniref:hypothetical protein n=1 Tax=Pseudomonas sp. TaxID=306 RepID=UPI003CC58F7F
MTIALAHTHYTHLLQHHGTLLHALAQWPTPLSVFQRMSQRLSEDADEHTPTQTALLRLPKSYPTRLREYLHSETGQVHSAQGAQALADYCLAQVNLLHADGLLGDPHRLMAKSVHQWPTEAERGRYFGPLTRAYAVHLTLDDHSLDCSGSLLLAESAHIRLHSLQQQEDVGKLLLFTPGEGVRTFDNLEALRAADLLAGLRPGLRERDSKRLGNRARAPMTFTEVTDDVFAWLWAGWQQKQLDDFAYHLKHRELSALQGREWVVGLTAALDLRDALAPDGFTARRTQALLTATEPAWLGSASPRARQALAHRTRRLARYALQWQHLMTQLPGLKAFAKARVEGQLRRRLGRRINVDQLYVSEARVVALLPKLWKGLPWLIYSEIKHGRDLTALPDKALSNIGALDVDYWLTAVIVDQHGQPVPGLDPNLIRTVVREVDVGGTYGPHLRALIDTAPHLPFHTVFAQMQQADFALQRQRAAMGAPSDPKWAEALKAGHLPRASSDAAFDAHVDSLVSQAEAAATSDRQSNLHTAITLASAVAGAVASAINPWAGLAVNGLLSLPALVGGVQAMQRGDYEQAVDEIGGSLASLGGSVLDLRGAPVGLFRAGPEQLQARLLAVPPLPGALPALADAEVSLKGLHADPDGVYHVGGRHYIRHIDSPTQVRQLEVDYSREHATYRLLTPHLRDGFRQAIVRDDNLAWRARHAPVEPSAPPLEQESLQGMDNPTASAPPLHWPDAQLLAQAGLEPQHSQAFLEAAYYLDRDNYRFTEHEILAPAPPQAASHDDVMLHRAPVVFRPKSLSSVEVTMTRLEFSRQRASFHALGADVLASQRQHIEQLITMERQPGHHNLGRHQVLMDVAESVCSSLGYVPRATLHYNTLPVLICMHPHSRAYYVVYPRALPSGPYGRLRIPSHSIGLGPHAWEAFILEQVRASANHLLPELAQAHADGKLFPLLPVVDLTADAADSAIYVIKPQFVAL